VKDDIITLLEAMRLVKAELEGVAPRRTTNSASSLVRIAAIVNGPAVQRAIERLDPPTESPSIAPSLPGRRVH